MSSLSLYVVLYARSQINGDPYVQYDTISIILNNFFPVLSLMSSFRIILDIFYVQFFLLSFVCVCVFFFVQAQHVLHYSWHQPPPTKNKYNDCKMVEQKTEKNTHTPDSEHVLSLL